MGSWKLPFAALLALTAMARTDPSAAAAKPSKPKTRGAPGPIAGAGLPLVVAAGAYWLIKRRNKRAAEIDSK